MQTSSSMIRTLMSGRVLVVLSSPPLQFNLRTSSVTLSGYRLRLLQRLLLDRDCSSANHLLRPIPALWVFALIRLARTLATGWAYSAPHGPESTTHPTFR